MSFWYTSRTDDVYSAASLGNWTHPRVGKVSSALGGQPWQENYRPHSAKSATPSVGPTTRPTVPGRSIKGVAQDGLTPNFLVDGKGHLLPGKKRQGSSFQATGYDGFVDSHKSRFNDRINSAVGANGSRKGKDQFGTAVGYLVSNNCWPPTRAGQSFPLGSSLLLDGVTACKVMFHGETNFGKGAWVGLLLASPTGKNDGSIDGRRYFRAERNHGLFVRAGSNRLRPMSAVVRSSVPAVRYDDRLGSLRFGQTRTGSRPSTGRSSGPYEGGHAGDEIFGD